MGEIFGMFDYDHSGDIYTKDLEVCLMVFGKVYDADEIEEIKRDVDDHGIVHFPEFLRMIRPVVCGDRAEEAREVFNLMANLGEIIPEEEVDLMIKAADKDGDGAIDRDE